jgi:hypothetical protein
MDNFDREITKTLELLAYKVKEFESQIGDPYFHFSGGEPVFRVYEEDLKILEMTKYTFCTSLEFLERKGYIIINHIQDGDYVDPQLVDPDEIIDGVLIPSLFRINIPSSIFEVLEHYKRGTKPKEKVGHLTFKEDKSVLCVGGYQV